MAYCIQSDIEKIETEASVIQLTDDRPTDDENSGTVDTNNLNEAITLADGYIDSRLRGHVTLPLTAPYAVIIVLISAELSIVNLYKRRFGSSMPESILKRQAWAEKQLDEIVEGKIMLTDDSGTEQVDGNVKTRSRAKILTETYLEQY
jgi:phage gp36-like protein